MCNGTIMDKLISFSLPLMLSGILQLMFNAVDIIVIGRFSGSQSLAAVGFLPIYLLEYPLERMFYPQDFMRRAKIKKCLKPFIRQSHWR